MLYQLSYAGLLRSDLENSRGFFSLSSFPAFSPQSHQDSLITNTHPYCSREALFSTNKATQLSLNQTQLQSCNDHPSTPTHPIAKFIRLDAGSGLNHNWFSQSQTVRSFAGALVVEFQAAKPSGRRRYRPPRTIGKLRWCSLQRPNISPTPRWKVLLVADQN